ncbi:MAG: hypothetical protein C3F12_14020 [Candidatus Methylomirabilota bacterium]|nr:DUF86 domain-containing protein [Candidatus Methylomirabilis sp.]NJD68740.1 DUF86 domain-containing protein [candidate division NC10 bacterium]PWB43011.1 MAG: hypothetical protein C3F12_14020 [candidate division NC10 bacterium]
MPLGKEGQERLARILVFLETELADLRAFADMRYGNYQSDRDRRRNLERCIENIVNAALDIAKILLVSEGRPIPPTYKEYFLQLPAISGFLDEPVAEDLAEWARLRNILAHEYLDIRWQRIREFLDSGWQSYESLLKATEAYLRRRTT